MTLQGGRLWGSSFALKLQRGLVANLRGTLPSLPGGLLASLSWGLRPCRQPPAQPLEGLSLLCLLPILLRAFATGLLLSLWRVLAFASSLLPGLRRAFAFVAGSLTD